MYGRAWPGRSAHLVIYITAITLREVMLSAVRIRIGVGSLLMIFSLGLGRRASLKLSWLRTLVARPQLTRTRVSFHNLEKRIGKGFSVLANYTWSKAQDDEGPAVKGWASLLTNSWEITGIDIWQNGFRFTVYSGVDNSFSGVGSDRPHGKLVNQYFDTALLTTNAIGTDGNAPRNVLANSGLFNIDIGVIKYFPINERMQVQFRSVRSSSTYSIM